MKKKIRQFKILDPIIQSLFFVLFTYCINADLSYKLVFYSLVAWQLISSTAHFSFKKTTMLKKQRKIHLAAILAYIVIYAFIVLLVPESYVIDHVASGTLTVPVYSVVLISVGLGLCFWYNIICLREIRRMLKKAHQLEV